MAKRHGQIMADKAPLEALLARGMDDEEIGRTIGVSSSTVKKWRNGSMALRLPHYLAMEYVVGKQEPSTPKEKPRPEVIVADVSGPHGLTIVGLFEGLKVPYKILSV